MAKIKLLGPFPVKNSQSVDHVEGKTVADALRRVAELDSELGRHIIRSNGSPHAHVRIFVNGKDINTIKGLDSKVSDRDELMIIQALAGG